MDFLAAPRDEAVSIFCPTPSLQQPVELTLRPELVTMETTAQKSEVRGDEEVLVCLQTSCRRLGWLRNPDLSAAPAGRRSAHAQPFRAVGVCSV